MNQDKLNKAYGYLTSSYSTSYKLYIPSTFNKWIRDNKRYDNYNYFFVCRPSENKTMFVNTNNNISSANSFRSYYIIDNVFYYDDYDFYNISTDYQAEFRSILSNNCYNSMNSDFTFNVVPTYFYNVGANNYDDFVYSKEPSEIILSFVYCLIPLILFIFGIKVLRKGLFK